MRDGMQVLTDNWLLEEVADLLTGRIATPKDLSLITIHNSSFDFKKKLSRGVFQFAALFQLLELIVLSEKIHFLGGHFASTWMGKENGIDLLFTANIIKEAYFPPNACKDTSEKYQNELLSYPNTEVKYGQIDSYSYHDHTSLIVDGSCTYLALADNLNHVYCPHPAREVFLDSILCFPRWPCDSIGKFEEMITSSRIKLAQAARPSTSRVTQLSCMLPSFSMLVLNETTSPSSLIRTAIEVRNDNNVEQLRHDLQQMTQYLQDNDSHNYLLLCKKLEKTLSDVERKLGIRTLNDKDGPSTISVFSLPIKIPDMLRAPLLRTPHATIISDLINTGIIDAENKIVKIFGTESRILVKSLVDWYSSRRTKSNV